MLDSFDDTSRSFSIAFIAPDISIGPKRMAAICPLNVILPLLMLHLSPIVFANCTANCITAKREWPKFDFEFYYEHSGDGPSLQSSLLSYSILNTDDLTSSTLPYTQYLTPSFNVFSSHFESSTLPPATPSLTLTKSNSLVSFEPATISPTGIFPIDMSSSAANCSGENDHKTNASETQLDISGKDPLQNYLLRTVFHSANNLSHVPHNLSVHFQDKLSSIYEQALSLQKGQLINAFRRRLLSSENSTLNLTVWDLQVDNSLKTIDVIYYIQRDGILVPFDDAAKIMTFVSNEFIRYQTGYEVLHKISRYNREWADKQQSAMFNWLNLTSLIALLLVLLLCIAFVSFLYVKYRNEKRKWLNTINKELNRVMPSNSNTQEDEDEDEDQSHWNYGQDEDHDEGNTNVHHPSTSRGTDKIDKSSQYDYGAFEGYQRTPQMEPSTSGTSTGYYRERLIPVGSSSVNDSDYDRISYVRTQETLQETKKHPNILEIQLSKETQSIVQEIRKELNRYNFKKIISQPNSEHSTSEA